MYLMRKWPKNAAATAFWLETQGISKELRYKYQKSGWIESLGVGAFRKLGEKVGWEGGLYALQQDKLPVHMGGLIAADHLGFSHYLRFARKRVHLFAPSKTTLPQWFRSHEWEGDVELHSTNFLPSNLGFITYNKYGFDLRISSSERAILECLYLAPAKMDLMECYQILEGMSNLRPQILQSLLESCTSIKVKRLFLCFAEQANHAWFKYLDQSSISLGSGSRMLVKGDVYMPRYKISVPKELVKSHANSEL
jgi:hypothetical protein